MTPTDHARFLAIWRKDPDGMLPTIKEAARRLGWTIDQVRASIRQLQQLGQVDAKKRPVMS